MGQSAAASSIIAIQAHGTVMKFARRTRLKGSAKTDARKLR
jgi:hypothetical protein